VSYIQQQLDNDIQFCQVCIAVFVLWIMGVCQDSAEDIWTGVTQLSTAGAVDDAIGTAAHNRTARQTYGANPAPQPSKYL
jgi:hypothetical protein